MSLRRSPLLTPAALAARRANSLKCTGPKTPRGKAWSSMNGLRHGWDARNLRAKIERTGDKEALAIFDWIFTRFFQLTDMETERDWSYHLRLAARIWCHITGRVLLPRAHKGMAKGWVVDGRVYRYGGGVFRPRSLTVLNFRGLGIRLTNPLPSQRRRMRFAWLPEVDFVDPPPRLPRAKRVRQSKADAKGSGAVPRRVAPDPAVGPESRSNREAAENVVGAELECPLDSVSLSATLSPLLSLLDAAALADPRSLRSDPNPAPGSKGEAAKNVVGPKLECSLDSSALAATVSPILSLLAAAGLGDLKFPGLEAGFGERPAEGELSGRGPSEPGFHCKLWDQPMDADPEDGDPGCSPPCEDCPIWEDCLIAPW
ncbi:MAG TPA: hypothetical protein VGZ29_01535 [Terriglobia bacterium]|nr:hypothetical protein [Terriglobia bacterium]